MSAAASTIAVEVETGRRYSPEIAWPTIRLAIGVWLAFGASTWSALAGLLPYWLAAVLNTVILYASYTVIHEATHNNIVPRIARLRWVNTFLGFAVCALLWLVYYPHKRSHMVHHARCNTDDDPDIYARGPFGTVAFWRIPLSALGQMNPLALHRDLARYKVPPVERAVSYATFAAYTGLVVLLVALGHGTEVLVLWFLPWLVGYSTMLVFFTWVPHHPHVETGRYRNTRCSVWPGANFLTQGQHMHLIHHMMAWIPYYHYEQVFHEIRPCLEQNGAMIDGFWPRSGSPHAAG